MLGFLLDLSSTLERDQSHPLGERHRRDREAALAHGWSPASAQAGARLAILHSWWAHCGDRLVSTPAPGAGLDRALRLGAVLLTLLGGLIGASVAGLALRYDGSAPVNLVSLFGVLIVLPGIMLLLTLLLLPGRAPGLGWLQDVLASFSPGQWLSAWLNRHFPEAHLGWFGQPRRSAPEGLDLRAVSRWQLVLYGQIFAIAFFLASLAVVLLRITFSDLTFGWSTTLEVAPERVSALVAALARPFELLWPAAVPEPALVGLSRFSRAQALAPQQVQSLGDWWPFVVGAIALYGLIPRVLLAMVARWRLRAVTRQALLGDPRVQRLFERMETALVDHQVDRREGAAPRLPDRAASAPDAAAQVPVESRASALVNWNEAVAAEALDHWARQHCTAVPATTLALSTQTELATEQAQLDALTASAVVVLAKAWEPPLLEFLDLLQRLRDGVGDAGRVLVVPVAVGGGEPTAMDLGIWTQAVAALEDVRIVVWQWSAAESSS
ncbi:MAG: DUF2868 domain-containing protein [Pseudomonadota bacterium]